MPFFSFWASLCSSDWSPTHQPRIALSFCSSSASTTNELGLKVCITTPSARNPCNRTQDLVHVRQTCCQPRAVPPSSDYIKHSATCLCWDSHFNLQFSCLPKAPQHLLPFLYLFIIIFIYFSFLKQFLTLIRLQQWDPVLISLSPHQGKYLKWQNCWEKEFFNWESS